MIRLRPIAITNLSFIYAHNVGNGVIKHYRLNYADTLTNPKTPVQMVSEFVKTTLNEDVEILPSIHKQPASGAPVTLDYSEAIHVSLASEVLKDMPEAKKQLERLKVNSLLHQYIDIPLDRHHLWNFLALSVNFVLNKINKIYHKFKYKNIIPYTEDGPIVYGSYLFPKLIQTLPYKNRLHKIVPCQFLSVSFSEEDGAKALELLRKDLKILADRKLILGHLIMPSQIELADTIGDGQKRYALFCFLFVDLYKLQKDVGKDPIEMSNEMRKNGIRGGMELSYYLGLKTQVMEGEVGVDISSGKYVIEIIDIFAKEHQENLQSYAKSIEESIAAGKRIAAKKKTPSTV